MIFVCLKKLHLLGFCTCFKIEIGPNGKINTKTVGIGVTKIIVGKSVTIVFQLKIRECDRMYYHQDHLLVVSFRIM